ncbi:MAG: hypothetical protein KBB83_06995 [Alphaproteobacteria bacterium]|nr:hypothetical protein [Alphaproteobacteria bacterium]
MMSNRIFILFLVSFTAMTFSVHGSYPDEDLDRALALSLAQPDLPSIDHQILRLVPESHQEKVLGCVYAQQPEDRAEYGDKLIFLMRQFPEGSKNDLMHKIGTAGQSLSLDVLDSLLLAFAEDPVSCVSLIESMFSVKSVEPVLDATIFPDHRVAVGQVFAGNYTGTATRIEPGLLLSAAHVLEMWMPKKETVAQKSGPIVIGFPPKKVVWAYQLAANSEPFYVPVTHMVFEAEYLHARALGNADIFPYQEARDLVFLKLDERNMLPNLPVLPLITKLEILPQMCAAFGYGRTNDPMKQRLVDRGEIVHQFEALPQTGEWNGMRLRYDEYNPDQYSNETRREVQMLLHRPQLDGEDSFVSRINEAQSGDSGGPLCAVTPSGVRVIGVTSNYDRNGSNGFASLLKTIGPEQYTLNPKVQAMLNALKRG